MSAVRNRDTQPELLLRRELWGRGLRYRVRNRLTGRPDLVFAGARLAVFVDGDFWHGHGWRERGFSSMEQQFEGRNNAGFWRAKIRRNVERDAEVTAALEAEGWTVLRLLESELRRDTAAAADRVAARLRGSA
jgi:DNA mismatch endonuclease (patch repair protein)